MLNQKRVCLQCGSKLILVSKVTERLEGSLFPQTTSIYRCSNNECQKEKDKAAAKRAEINNAKVVADKKRAEQKLADQKMKNDRAYRKTA